MSRKNLLVFVAISASKWGMASIPKAVSEAFEKRTSPPVLTTVDSKGVPNTVWVSVLRQLDEESIAIADFAFHKTLANIHSGGPTNFLFLAEEGAYQLKGRIEYHTEGPVFDAATEWAQSEIPLKGIAVFKTEKIYKGAERIV